MSDPKRVTVGEVLRGIRAADHNAFYDTWRKVNQFPPKHSPKPKAQIPGQLLVTVSTEEATPIDSDFPVLALTGLVLSPETRDTALHDKIAFVGATPTADTTPDEIAIMQGPMFTSISRGVISGYTYVMVNWTDEAHTHCRIKAGDNTQLESAASGITILEHETIPDPEYLPATLWAVIKLGGRDHDRLVRGVITATTFASNTPTITITPIEALAGGTLPDGELVVALGDCSADGGGLNTYDWTELRVDDWVIAAYSPGQDNDVEWVLVPPDKRPYFLKVTSGFINAGSLTAPGVADPGSVISIFGIDASGNYDTPFVGTSVVVRNTLDVDAEPGKIYSALLYRGRSGLTNGYAEFVIVGGGGGGGGDVPDWVFVYPDDPIPTAGITIVAGYAIDTAGTGTVTIDFDPTEITGFGAEFQFFRHLETDTTPTSPHWRNVSGFEDDKNQMWWHQSDAFKFETTNNYDESKVQYLGHDAGQWKWKKNPANYTAAITGTIAAGSASVPTAGAATIYQIGVGGAATSLGSHAIYNPYGIRAKGSCACVLCYEHPTDSAQDEFLISGPPLVECTEEVVTDVSCVADEIVYNTVEIVYAAVECPA